MDCFAVPESEKFLAYEAHQRVEKSASEESKGLYRESTDGR